MPSLYPKNPNLEVPYLSKIVSARVGMHIIRATNNLQLRIRSAEENLILLRNMKQLFYVCTTDVRSYVCVFISRCHLLQQCLILECLFVIFTFFSLADFFY